jgi:hypothetical protein
MATPAEKLADSLQKLQELQDQGVVAIKSEMLSRTHRERLLKNKFIEEVYKGWYLIVPPTFRQGDSTVWFSNYWEFCAQYLEDRFGEEWCVSAEQSLMLHAGNTTIPSQLIVRSPKANNATTPLLYNTSLFLLKANLPDKNECVVNQGIRMYSLPAALVRCSPNTYTQNPLDVRTGLSLLNDSSEILELLLNGGHSVIAGRVSGAFKNMGKEKIALTISETMIKAGYAIRVTDPFESKAPAFFTSRIRSPYESRIKLMWMGMRERIIEQFPPEPGIPSEIAPYIRSVEDIFITDAYHSLSIEKYRVTPEMIEKIRAGNWDTETNKTDSQQRDAMAARGYWDAFNSVKMSVKKVLEKSNPGQVADEDHGDWYRELFGPSVVAGLLQPSDLSGYRNHQVYIGNSMHTPLNKEAVRDAMPVLFQLLTEEPSAAVRAVLGHFVFVYIHPYMDGNGRMGRFLMNVMLASGGYPWTVIPVEQRDTYMQALEQTSTKQDIKPFTNFLAQLVDSGMKGMPIAKV